MSCDLYPANTGSHGALQEQQQPIPLMVGVGFGSGMPRRRPGRKSRSGTLSGRCWATASLRTQPGGDEVEVLRLSSMPWPMLGSHETKDCTVLVLPEEFGSKGGQAEPQQHAPCPHREAKGGSGDCTGVLAQWAVLPPAGVACQHFIPEGSGQQMKYASSCSESMNWCVPAATLWHEGSRLAFKGRCLRLLEHRCQIAATFGTACRLWYRSQRQSAQHCMANHPISMEGNAKGCRQNASQSMQTQHAAWAIYLCSCSAILSASLQRFS